MRTYDDVLEEKKTDALHTAHATVTHGTRAHTRMTTFLKPVPTQKRQELWRAVQLRRDTYQVDFWSTKHQPSKNKWGKEKERLPGLELASSNSKLHPSYLDRRPVFFLEK